MSVIIVETHKEFEHGVQEPSLPNDPVAALYMTRQEVEPFILQNGIVYKLFDCTFTVSLTHGSFKEDDVLHISVTAPIVADVDIDAVSLTANWPEFASVAVEGNIRLPERADVFMPGGQWEGRDWGCIQAYAFVITSGEWTEYAKLHPTKSFEDYVSSNEGRTDFALWSLLPGLQESEKNLSTWRERMAGSPDWRLAKLEALVAALGTQ